MDQPQYSSVMAVVAGVPDPRPATRQAVGVAVHLRCDCEYHAQPAAHPHRHRPLGSASDHGLIIVLRRVEWRNIASGLRHYSTSVHDAVQFIGVPRPGL